MPVDDFRDEWRQGQWDQWSSRNKKLAQYAVPAGFLILFLVITAQTSFFVVEPYEVGVLTRFGKFSSIKEPGLHFQMPWFIDRVQKVPVQRMKMEFGFRTEKADVRTEYSRQNYRSQSLMLTGDLNIAVVEWIVHYQISNPRDYLFNIADPERALRDASEAVMREVVGDHSVTEVLTSGRAEINATVEKRLQEVIDLYECGLRIATVKLQDVTPPDRVKNAFNEVNQAKQEKERTINQAFELRNKVIPEARGKAKKMVAEAEGFKTRRVNEAKGDTERFKAILAEYKKAPEITRKRLYLETLKDVLPKIRKKIITDGTGGGTPLPLLHLGSQGSKSGRAE